MHFGALITGRADVRGERLRRLALVERLFDPLPIDEEVARSYGRLTAAVASAGRSPRGRVMDLLIAATAHPNGARLYTLNASDLHGLEHLVEIATVWSAIDRQIASVLRHSCRRPRFTTAHDPGRQ